MTRVFNFSAGPAVLPEEVLAQAAAEMSDWIPEIVSADRLAKVLALQDEISSARNHAWIGREVEILVDRTLSKRDSGLGAGRTPHNKIVHFRGENVAEGKLANVQITEATSHHLKGVLIPSS
jgi:tRNA-2-methylthio-N6-dimethylallyladenosine synthase